MITKTDVLTFAKYVKNNYTTYYEYYSVENYKIKVAAIEEYLMDPNYFINNIEDRDFHYYCIRDKATKFWVLNKNCIHLILNRIEKEKIQKFLDNFKC